MTGDGVPPLRVRVAGFEHLDPCVYPSVLAALGQHLGFDPEPLLKAAGGGTDEGDDPRFPRLFRLIELARKDWARWGERLIRVVAELHKAGKLFPLSPANEARLRELLRDHEVAMLVSFTGRTPPGEEKRVRRLVDEGLVPDDYGYRGANRIAYRLGRQLDHLKAMPELEASNEAMGQLIIESLKAPLTPQDEEAIAYVQRRGEVYMRRPVEDLTGEVHRVLNEKQRLLDDEELRKLRATTERGVRERMSADELARELRAAVEGHPTLTNDFDRVARTELCFAHAQGSCAKLVADAKQAGITDPEVYKIVSPKACHDCVRIWGPPTKPIPYKLSYVLQRDAAGGNFRLPRAQWGPCVGPLHPHCTEGSLLLYHPSIVAGATALAARVKQQWTKKP